MTLDRGRPLNARDVEHAYRLVLRRDVDAPGLAHYVERGQQGMTMLDLVEVLIASDEYRQLPSESPDSRLVDHPLEDPSLIRPADVMRALSLDDLNATSEEYYRRVTDPTPLMAKPFAYLHETPQMLHDLGLLLSGMRLGKSMTVLDFGAGTCWLSRILAQLNCQPICCDVSLSALEIGRRLFAELPPIGTVVYTPQFLQFDGRHIDLPDASVDRIICFDAFHHVPNPGDVIAEFGRVLRPGGLAGFSEPGPHHSRSAQSQYEMRHHKVLENDIDLFAINEWAIAAGFTRLTAHALTHQELSLDEYRVLTSGSDDAPTLRTRLWQNTMQETAGRSVFYLHKGEPEPDSRTHDGLAHSLTVDRRHLDAQAGQPFRLVFSIKNTGRARWLHTNTEIFGVVRLGTHLFRMPDELINIDHSRHGLPSDVQSGEQITLDVDVVIAEPGDYRLVCDLVAEGVTWFENQGSQTVSVHVTVR